MRAASRVALGLLLLGGDALAASSPESRAAERKSLDLEMDLLRKKLDGLSINVEGRQRRLRERLRALYKISQGGPQRLLAGTESPSEFYARRDGVALIVRRDVEELAAIRRELDDAEAAREQLRSREARAAELDGQGYWQPPGRLARKGALARPVHGPVLGHVGPWRDPGSDLWRTRDGVELVAHAKEPVRAIADGEVRAVEEVTGLGLCVVIDHDDGFVSLLGRLQAPAVKPGDRVRRGQAVALAAEATVQLQLIESGAWLDPSSWLGR